MREHTSFYIGRFYGNIRKNLKVENYSIESVIEDTLKQLSKNEDGELKIYKINFSTRERRLVKKVLIVSELFLSKEELNAYVF
jgi:hypothetical protein